MGMNNLPARKTTVPAKRESRALARKQDFKAKVAALRKATGKAETRVIPFRCAVTGRRFVVTFERLDPADKFRIVRTEKDPSAANEAANPLRRFLAAKATSAESFDAGEFDRSGWHCPWCGHDEGAIHCGRCGETVCGGRTKTHADGAETFHCHEGCGNSGRTVPTDRVHGSAGGRASRPGKAAPKLPGPGGMPLLEFRKSR